MAIQKLANGTLVSVATAPNQADLRASDILTPQQLADRLQVQRSWVFEQTRKRAKIRNRLPLPHFRMGKYLRFYWPDVSEWLRQQQDKQR